MNLIIPSYYRSPLGLPLYWRDEQSGVLARAISAYLDSRLKGAEMTPEQFNLLKAFLTHYIFAPCWRGPTLDALRAEVHGLSTPDDVHRWIRRCLEIGLDPL